MIDTFRNQLSRLTGSLRGDGLGAQLLRSGIGSFALKIGNVLFTSLGTIVLARVMGAENFGIYAFALSGVTLLALPVQSGIPPLVVREIAKFQLHEQWGLMKGVILRANQAVGLLSLIVMLGGGIFLWVRRAEATAQIETFAWALLLIPLIGLGNLRGATLRGLRHVVQGQLPEMVLRPLFIFLFGIAAMLIGGLSPQGAMKIQIVSAFIAFTIGGILLWRTMPQKAKTATTAYETRLWAASVLPFALLSGMDVVNKQTDILMLGFLSNAYSVGLYKVAAQGSVVTAFALAPIGMVIAPYITRFHHQNDLVRLQKVALKSARVGLVTSGIISFIFIIFGRLIIIKIFGAEYEEAYLPFAILSLAQVINGATGSVSYILNMTGHERVTLRESVACAVGNIILNVVLISFLGIVGAAIATGLTLMTWNVRLCLHARRLLRINSTPFAFLNLDTSRK